MRVVHGGHFWQLGSIASLATKTTGGEIVVAFWPKHGLRSNLRVPNLKNFPGGACTQTRNGRTEKVSTINNWLRPF